MLTDVIPDTELAEIRAKVAEEPEGSIARRLLAEVDARRAESNRRATVEFLNYLRGQGLTDEEAEKVMKHVEAGNPIENEEGPCRKCNGTGHVDEMGCMGSKWQRCPSCRGRCRDLMRIKVPA